MLFTSGFQTPFPRCQLQARHHSWYASVGTAQKRPKLASIELVIPFAPTPNSFIRPRPATGETSFLGNIALYHRAFHCLVALGLDPLGLKKSDISSRTVFFISLTAVT